MTAMAGGMKPARARAHDWCILRTSPGRTLSLAKSLVEAKLDVWTPMQVQSRRRPRSKDTVEIEAPIMPTFVFARSSLLPELLRIEALPISPHPPFSIYRYLGGIVELFDREITNLRAVEELAQRARLKKSHRYVFPAGQKVNVSEGNFTGLEGVVQGGDGKYALVCFGGSVQFKIATFLLRSEDIEAASAREGIAA
jgi:transcription antitermination factor NusG